MKVLTSLSSTNVTPPDHAKVTALLAPLPDAT
jgi:hypothetical protein